MMISSAEKVQNIVGNGEKADDQHFLIFPTMFSIGILQGSLKSGINQSEIV